MQNGSPQYSYSGTADHSDKRFALITTAWHEEIIQTLYDGAVETLNQYGVTKIERFTVPGSFEIPYAVRLALDSSKFEAIITLGCIVKGETQHDEFIAHAVTQSLSMLTTAAKMPIMLGILTVNNLEQARERAGGSHGHKGKECAVGALQLLDLAEQIKGKRIPSGFRLV